VADLSGVDRNHVVPDELTGLASTALLYERIGRATNGLRHPGARGSVALVRIDVGGVDGRSGEVVADLILVEIAGRIGDAVRPGDTVARSAREQFVVLCERLDSSEDAVMIADRLDTSFEAPFGPPDRPIALDVTISIAVADRESPDLQHAMGEPLAGPSARTDDGRWQIFDEHLRSRAAQRRQIETDLRATADGQDLELHYQPVVSLHTGLVTGVEALLRWRRGDELLGPDAFIPLAEDTGLIIPIGNWVLRTACEQVARWQQLPGWHGLRLAVNVSARQLQLREFAGLAVTVADETGLAPGTLAIEITESVLLDDVESSGQHLDHLKQVGIEVSLDDFGTGYSSLTYLRGFPVDSVKLDRSFVAGTGTDPGDTAIVTAVVNLASALGLECIAEGIETEAQLKVLRSLGCDSGQGYLFSPGIPPQQFRERFLDPVPLPFLAQE